ncbi:MAG: restriction endonuclease [Ectothiorhodospiraceae bacterium AqS1]|nr:restriction endonuclease [Ectothiorhodospiraceae bacterium AqS1]
MKKTSAIDGAYRYFIESLICPEDPCLYLSPVPKGKKHGGELVPSNADFSSSVSVRIARQWARRLASELTVSSGKRGGQQVGRAFERIVARFVDQSFSALKAARPGVWKLYGLNEVPDISHFCQYAHLGELERVLGDNRELKASLGGGHIIKPDIILSRSPYPDDELEALTGTAVSEGAKRAILRQDCNPKEILHAGISVKWTIRSDRAQNARSEALNLIRNRKDRMPHIVVVTAEPAPGRIGSLALGTGDIDCVYHIALDALLEAVESVDAGDAYDHLRMMVDGRRLKDIRDLPYDLIV